MGENKKSHWSYHPSPSRAADSPRSLWFCSAAPSLRRWSGSIPQPPALTWASTRPTTWRAPGNQGSWWDAPCGRKKACFFWVGVMSWKVSTIKQFCASFFGGTPVLEAGWIWFKHRRIQKQAYFPSISRMKTLTFHRLQWSHYSDDIGDTKVAR